MLDLILKAIAYSSGIALMAAGITTIYMATGTFNFTHASLVAWGFYVVYTLHKMFGGSPYYYVPLAALFSGFLGVMIYVTVNRILLKKGAGMVTLMMSTLGVDLVLFSFLNIFADYLTRVYKFADARYFVMEVYDVVLFKIGEIAVRGIAFISFAVVLVVTIALHLFLKKTKFGIAMRATIENPALASMLGINPESVYVTAWFIGGALAGLGGGLISLAVVGYPAVGMYTIVTMFCGAIVGGLYSIYGSLLGGFLIGLSEYLGIYALAGAIGGGVLAYRPVIPLIVMAVTLLIYPTGLAGIRWSALYERWSGKSSSSKSKR